MDEKIVASEDVTVYDENGPTEEMGELDEEDK